MLCVQLCTIVCKMSLDATITASIIVTIFRVRFQEAIKILTGCMKYQGIGEYLCYNVVCPKMNFIYKLPCYPVQRMGTFACNCNKHYNKTNYYCLICGKIQLFLAEHMSTVANTRKKLYIIITYPTNHISAQLASSGQD